MSSAGGSGFVPSDVSDGAGGGGGGGAGGVSGARAAGSDGRRGGDWSESEELARGDLDI